MDRRWRFAEGPRIIAGEDAHQARPATAQAARTGDSTPTTLRKPVIVKASSPSSPTGPTVLLVENNRLLRDGMESMLAERGIQVVAAVQHGAEALRQLARHRPQVVLLDSALGDCDTVAFVDSLRTEAPDSRLVVMGLLPVHEEVVAFVRAGVSGFLLKSATIEEFVRTIEDVAGGAHVLPPPLMGALFTHVAAQAMGRGRRGARAAVRMTKREREVIGAIADGLGNKEIASRLGLAAHTVKGHVHNILEKLALHSRLEIAAYHHAEGGSDRD